MNQRPLWETNNRSPAQGDVPNLYGTRELITAYARAYS
jgi:hypothetical protein